MLTLLIVSSHHPLERGLVTRRGLDLFRDKISKINNLEPPIPTRVYHSGVPLSSQEEVFGEPRTLALKVGIALRTTDPVAGPGF